MPPIRTSKGRPGPKAKLISSRQLKDKDLKPIVYVERTYSQKQKIRVLVFLNHHQIPLPRPSEYRSPTQREAAELYKIPQHTISDWVRGQQKIEEIGEGSPVKRNGSLACLSRVLWPQLEVELFEDFKRQREAGRTVRQGWFRIQAQFRFREIYPDVDPIIFRFSNGWFQGFLAQHKISLRTITKKAQKVPQDYRALILNWLRFNRCNSQPRISSFWETALPHPVGGYELSNICNLDETPIPFEYLEGKTYDMKGEKTVWVKESRSGWDKRQASLVLCIFADGILRVPPMVIFHGTGQRLAAEKAKYHPGILVEFNPTAYMNDRLFEWYIREHLLPVLGGRPTLFALDLMGSHKTPAILDLLCSNHITPSFIPGGCTRLVQPLDVSVNKPFKELVRELTDEKIFELESIDQFERWTVGDRCVVTTFCIGDAFYQFHQEKGEIIRRAFRKVGLSLPIDGSSDSELDIKGFHGLQIGNWEEEIMEPDERADISIENDQNEDIEFVNT